MIQIKKFISIKHVRQQKNSHKRYCFLNKSPQKLVVCRKNFIAAPKKPNSANRKVSKAQINQTKKYLFVYIPGQGPHNLSNYSQSLMRGGRVRDLPGIRYKLIRGTKDFKGDPRRKTSRSKYGAKKTSER